MNELFLRITVFKIRQTGVSFHNLWLLSTVAFFRRVILCRVEDLLGCKSDQYIWQPTQDLIQSPLKPLGGFPLTCDEESFHPVPNVLTSCPVGYVRVCMNLLHIVVFLEILLQRNPCLTVMQGLGRACVWSYSSLNNVFLNKAYGGFSVLHQNDLSLTSKSVSTSVNGDVHRKRQGAIESCSITFSIYSTYLLLIFIHTNFTNSLYKKQTWVQLCTVIGTFNNTVFPHSPQRFKRKV